MPKTDSNVLEIIELTKVFRDFWGRDRVKAVDGLNLDVKRGEVFGLLGPNGSGKTTTVRIVLGLLFPTNGAVRLFGRSPREVDVKQRVGYMPEESNLYSYLNAEETLDFFARLFGLARSERRRRAEALIDMVGLKRARMRPVGEYSKGMARRIGLAQSLINDPDLLILDEPTTGLDPVGAREMKDLILTLRDRGKTIFLCSHLLADVEEVCDRIAILYGGKQRALGPVEKLLVAAERTQIRAPRLDSRAVEKIRNVIRESAGGDAQIDVSAPTRRLEEYFLEVVREARKERLATAGAEMGTGTAEFLAAEEPEGEGLLEDLVAAGREAEQEVEESPEPEVAPVHGVEDHDFIDELVNVASEGSESPDESEEDSGPAVTPEKGLDESLLSELINDSGEEAEPDEEDQ